MGSMERNKLGEYDYLRAPITQLAATTENYEIKPHFFKFSSIEPMWRLTIEDVGMHLNTFTKICDMMRIKDVEQNVVKLCLCPFSLRGKEKDWFLASPRVLLHHVRNVLMLFYLSFASS
jgi:hypothetical protein